MRPLRPVSDNAARLMHQQMHLRIKCPRLCLYMLPCTFLHSFTAMDMPQIQQRQQTCRVIMLSLPQTLPARMYVPYLAGEVHISAVSSPSCVTIAKLCLDADCASMAFLLPFLLLHQSSMCSSCTACSSALSTTPYKAWLHSE